VYPEIWETKDLSNYFFSEQKIHTDHLETCEKKSVE